MKRSKLWVPLFLGPCVFSFFIVIVVPMIMGIYFSFTNWNGINNNADFIGLQNYIDIFTKDENFLKVFIFTAKFAFISVILINVIGFFLALLVTQGLKGSNFLRSALFMPNLIGGLILGFVWQFIFTKAFDNIGAMLGIEFLRGWLSTTSTGFWGLVILMSWQMSGYMMVIYIAAIQNISESMYEAAKIDGANALQRLTNITLPLVMPAFTVGMFLSLSNSFKLFDQNLALTQGGPYKSTQMLAYNIYESAFIFNKLGLAQAKAVVFLITVAVITLTQISYTKRREVEM